jgi:hypothetical protein
MDVCVRYIIIIDIIKGYNIYVVGVIFINNIIFIPIAISAYKYSTLYVFYIQILCIIYICYQILYNFTLHIHIYITTFI